VFVAPHFLVFIFGSPAIANVLVLLKPTCGKERRIFAGVAFGVVFTCLVVTQYVVTDEWYGPDEGGGPFSSVFDRSRLSPSQFTQLPPSMERSLH
jgi:hypothetical protein